MLDSQELEDPAEIERSHRVRQSRDLRWVLLSVALLMLGMALADHLLSPAGDSRAFVSLSMCGVALLAYLLLRSTRSGWEGPLLVTGGLLVSAWAVYSYGSVRTAATFGFLAVVVVAGSYLRLRALWATTLAGVLLLAVLTWAEAGGLLVPPGMRPDLRYWLMGCVIALVIGVQLYQSRKATEVVYQRHLSQVEDRIRLEYERDQSLRRFRRIFLLNPTALLVQTASTQAVVEVNPAFERSLGYRGDQIEGQAAQRFWADAEQWRAHGQELFDKGRTDWHPARWRRADGTVLEVLVCSELSEDSGGLLILTTVVDQT
jgi:PAS domain S-box-containing protein